MYSDILCVVVSRTAMSRCDALFVCSKIRYRPSRDQLGQFLSSGDVSTATSSPVPLADVR